MEKMIQLRRNFIISQGIAFVKGILQNLENLIILIEKIKKT